MIHIAFNIDHRYVRHCAVTLASVFSNNPQTAITAHIIGRGITSDDRKALEEVTRLGRGGLRFYEPDAHLLDGFAIHATHGRITMATYYRCFLAEMLPADIDRVIYLDSDLLVLRPLQPLWEIPLNGAWVGAADDIGCNEAARYQRLSYPQQDSYFNSGVLLINLATWRSQGMGRHCCEYYNTHQYSIVFNDQDVLNGLLHDKRRRLDIAWNAQDGFYRHHNAMGEAWQDTHLETLRHPAILHFTNRKPWDYDSQHPLRRLYYQYLDLTPWRGRRPWHNPLNLVKRFVRLLPFRLHWREARYIRL